MKKLFVLLSLVFFLGCSSKHDPYKIVDREEQCAEGAVLEVYSSPLLERAQITTVVVTLFGNHPSPQAKTSASFGLKQGDLVLVCPVISDGGYSAFYVAIPKGY